SSSPTAATRNRPTSAGAGSSISCSARRSVGWSATPLRLVFFRGAGGSPAQGWCRRAARTTKTTIRATMGADCREFGYTPDDPWAKRPAGWAWKEATAVATASRDRVYVFNRGEHPLMVFDRDGTFLTSWGEGLFTRPHGICIGPDDSVYLT